MVNTDEIIILICLYIYVLTNKMQKEQKESLSKSIFKFEKSKKNCLDEHCAQSTAIASQESAASFGID